MSKTDKTKPYWVKVAEHHHVEQHHHSKHDCNLPTSARDQLKIDFSWDDCHWSPTALYWRADIRPCCGGCPCEMCSQRYWRRLTRRKARRQARDAIHRGDWDSLSGRVKDVW